MNFFQIVKPFEEVSKFYFTWTRSPLVTSMSRNLSVNSGFLVSLTCSRTLRSHLQIFGWLQKLIWSILRLDISSLIGSLDGYDSRVENGRINGAPEFELIVLGRGHALSGRDFTTIQIPMNLGGIFNHNLDFLGSILNNWLKVVLRNEPSPACWQSAIWGLEWFGEAELWAEIDKIRFWKFYQLW